MTLRTACRTIGLSAALLLGIAVGCVPPPSPPTTSKPVELKSATAAEVEAEIAANLGKVILVDCWFLGCPPCIERFPHFVELHRDMAAALTKKTEELDYGLV